MALFDRFKKSSQRNITSTNPARDWDIGFNNLGDFMSILTAINTTLKGDKAGIQTFTKANEQLRQSLVSWAYVCIDRISKEMASAEWYVSKRTRDGWEKVDLNRDAKADQFLNLLYNPFKYGSDALLKETIQRHLEACGFCCIEKIRMGKAIVGLIPISPDEIEPIWTQSKQIAGWQVESETGIRKLQTEDVIYIHYPHPKNVLNPLSPLMAASYGIDMNNTLYDYNAKLAKNDARFGLISPKGDLPLSKDKIDILKGWAKSKAGTVGGMELAPFGVDVNQVSLSPKDMDFVEGLKTISSEICNPFGYPRALITGESQNRSVMEVLQYLKNINCIIPRMTIVETALSNQLAQEVLGFGYWLSYERPKLVFSEDMKTAIEQVRVGMITINEWREDEGKEPVEWGEEPPKNAPPLQPGQYTQAEPPKTARIEKVIALKSIKAFDRPAEWKSFDAAVRLNERPFKDAMARYFGELQKQAMARAKNQYESSGEIRPDIIDYDAAKDKAIVYLKPFMINAMEHGYNRGVRQAGGDKSFEMDIWAKAFVETKLNKSSDEIIATTKAVITKLCYDKPPKKAADVLITLDDFLLELNGIFETWKDSRATTIAEAETVSLMNWGTQSGYYDSGVPRKEWLSQQDSEVRGNDPKDIYDHRLDGKAIPISFRFNTGGGSGLEYPGDPSGDPGDICHCRCTILPAWE